MQEKSEACYKAGQRFLASLYVKRPLLRIFQEEAEFVIGNPTELSWHKGPHTSYVGTLSDGETPGYWLLVLSTLYGGLIFHPTLTDFRFVQRISQ